jgi:predicted dehydrogenase
LKVSVEPFGRWVVTTVMALPMVVTQRDQVAAASNHAQWARVIERVEPPSVRDVLQIGFVGSGNIAWAHGLGLKAMIDGGIIDASIVAVYDPRQRRARAFADAVGGEDAAVVADAGEVARRCDAVWVCTPTSAHRDGVDQALATGSAVFCEKPLDRDLAAATALVDAVTAAGVASQCGLVLRSAPVFRALRALVEDGSLGAPMAAVFRDDQYFPIQGLYGSHWRAEVEQSGGGCLIEHSIHDVDILRFCFGEVDAVAARTANHAGHEGVEDLATVLLSFAAGLEVQLTSVWHEILTRGSTRRVEVFCRDGMAWLDDDFRGPLHVQTSEGNDERACPSPRWVEDLPLAHDEIGLAVRPYVEADRSFVDAVTGGREPEPGLTEALTAHRLVDAAYRSAAGGGQPVEVTSTEG